MRFTVITLVRYVDQAIVLQPTVTVLSEKWRSLKSSDFPMTKYERTVLNRLILSAARRLK